MRTNYLKRTSIILGAINAVASIAMGIIISSGPSSEGYIKSKIDLYHEVGLTKSIFLLFFPPTGLYGVVFLMLALILGEFKLVSKIFYILSMAMFMATAAFIVTIITSTSS